MLCCVIDLEPCLLSCPGSSVGRALCLVSGLLSCPGSSVGRALCLVSGVSWVRVPPRAAPFSKKELSWLVLLCLLCTCLAPLDSCTHLFLHPYSSIVFMVHSVQPKIGKSSTIIIGLANYENKWNKRVHCVCTESIDTRYY